MASFSAQKPSLTPQHLMYSVQVLLGFCDLSQYDHLTFFQFCNLGLTSVDSMIQQNGSISCSQDMISISSPLNLSFMWLSGHGSSLPSRWDLLHTKDQSWALPPPWVFPNQTFLTLCVFLVILDIFVLERYSLCLWFWDPSVDQTCWYLRDWTKHQLWTKPSARSRGSRKGDLLGMIQEKVWGVIL